MPNIAEPWRAVALRHGHAAKSFDASLIFKGSLWLFSLLPSRCCSSLNEPEASGDTSEGPAD